MDYKITGFIFDKKEYRDFDYLLFILTQNNEVVILRAKGLAKVSSKNAVACQYFMLSEFVYTPKSKEGYKSLKSVSILKQYHMPYQNLLVSGMFFLIYEVIQQVAQQMPLYLLCQTCFELLEQKKEPYDVLNYFFKQILFELGYQPSLDGCVFCHQRKELVSFDFESGGFICKNCYKPFIHPSFSSVQLKEIYSFLKEKEMVDLTFSTSQILFDTFVRFFKEQAGIHLQSYQFLKQIH